MKQKYLKMILLLSITAVTFMACNKAKNKHPGFKMTDSGLYYKLFHNEKDTIKPVLGDIMTMKMVYRTKDTLIFDSKNMPYPLRIPLSKPAYKGDFFEGLAMMSAGDSAVFIVNADSLYFKKFHARKMPDFLKSNTDIYFDIKILDIESKAETNKKLKKQEQVKLNEYIKKNNIKVKPSGSGLYYIETKRGHGKKPEKGDMVKLNFSLTLIDGTPIFSSWKKSKKPLEFEYGKRFDTEGLDEAIGMMRPGGKAKLIVPSKLAFGKNGRGNIIPPYTTFLYDVNLLSIKSKAEVQKEKALKQKKQEEENKKLKQEEPVKLKKYIKDNKITVKPTESGLYYVEIKKGTGKKAEVGKRVKVLYTGKLLDGTKFDSSAAHGGKPFEFTLGKHQVIKGWDEGIAKMRVGGKAELIMPSKLAYGKRGGGKKIPPYSPLVFEVELVDVNDVPAAK